jgi:hypothetical protein
MDNDNIISVTSVDRYDNHIYKEPGGVNDIDANTTSYLDTGPDSKITFSYRVCAYNDYGENCSNEVKAMTK